MKILIIVLALLIIATTLLSFKTRIIEKDRIGINANELDNLVKFSDSKLTIHYYSEYGAKWDIELENKIDGTKLTAKDESFSIAIKQIKNQLDALGKYSL